MNLAVLFCCVAPPLRTTCYELRATFYVLRTPPPDQARIPYPPLVGDGVTNVETLNLLNDVALGVFTFEVVVRITARGFYPSTYFKVSLLKILYY